MERASEALYSLKPVTFRHKKEIDAERTPQFGLVAEEVEKVNPDLVARDKEGKASRANPESERTGKNQQACSASGRERVKQQHRV
jgi:hypothetical protein